MPSSGNPRVYLFRAINFVNLGLLVYIAGFSWRNLHNTAEGTKILSNSTSRLEVGRQGEYNEKDKEELKANRNPSLVKNGKYLFARQESHRNPEQFSIEVDLGPQKFKLNLDATYREFSESLRLITSDQAYFREMQLQVQQVLVEIAAYPTSKLRRELVERLINVLRASEESDATVQELAETLVREEMDPYLVDFFMEVGGKVRAGLD